MYNFFVIKVINTRTQKRGFIAENETGIVVFDQYVGEVKQFESKKHAQKFIKEHKIEKNGVYCVIWSNDELIRDGHVGKKMEKDLYTVINLKGEHIFFDAGLAGYYFKNRDVGYCCWETEEDTKKFIQNMNFEFDVLVKKIEKKT